MAVIGRTCRAVCCAVLAGAALGLGAAPAQADDPCPSDPYEAASMSAYDDTPQEAVYNWNQALREAIQTSTGANASPTRVSRLAAIMNIGIFDVYNSIYWSRLEDLATGSPTTEQCGWAGYSGIFPLPPDTRADIVAGVVARDLMIHFMPEKEFFWESKFVEIVGVPFEPEVQWGEPFVDAVIALRTDDGSEDAFTYAPTTGAAGQWRLSPTASTQAPCTGGVTPHWGGVAPFGISSVSSVRQSRPDGVASISAFLPTAHYATDVNEVKDWGGEISANRTADQEEMAWFWANDLDGTYKPPGQLLEHTEIVAKTQPAAILTGDPEDFATEWSQQGIRVARLFAETSIAMADAAISAWDHKYLASFSLWRPIDAIRQADTDGNGSTTKDAAWEPLSADESGNQFSPCFPAWVSGHATFGGAWGKTMQNEFAGTTHTDPFPLELTTDDPNAVAVTREVDTFIEAAEENALSRIFLGVHYRIDAEGGLAAGYEVADEVTGNVLTWGLPCPGWSCV